MDRSLRYSILSVTALLCVGNVMLMNTMGWNGDLRTDSYIKPLQQLVYVVAGLVIAFFLSRTEYHIWKRVVWWLLGGSVLLLVLCFVPHIGSEIKGARRWISLGIIGIPSIRLQPSEVARLAVVVFLAWWFDRHYARRREFFRGFIQPLAVVSVVALLIVVEVDFGTTLLVLSVSFCLLFLAGTRFIYILIAMVLLGGAVATAIHFTPERMSRLTSFFDFENRDKYKYGDGLQQEQAKIALGSGGLTGLGLGNGRQKMDFLPEAHTDFIYAILGEELGLGATLGVVLCFSILLINGMCVSSRAPDLFGRLLGCGIVFMIGLQAAVNLCVVTFLAPNKGMPLPFVSYGGSNVVMCLVGIGILLSIARAVRKVPENELALTGRKISVSG